MVGAGSELDSPTVLSLAAGGVLLGSGWRGCEEIGLPAVRGGVEPRRNWALLTTLEREAVRVLRPRALAVVGREAFA